MSLSPHDCLAIPTTSHNESTIDDDITGGYYYDRPCAKLRSAPLYINIDIDSNDNDDADAYETDKISPHSFARIRGVVIAPQLNGKIVEILKYNANEEMWTVELQHCNNETNKYVNIREEFLAPIPSHNKVHKQRKILSIGEKQILRLRSCGYYLLLALIVISCTCLLLTPFWSFSSLIFGRTDGYIYYLCYTFFCGVMCCIIWSKKLRLNNIWKECRTCSIEAIVCYGFYMFCCILLWGMASYFGGFFFIYLWYCSQEMNASSVRINIFDDFMRKGYNEEYDIRKRCAVVYYYALNNYQSNMHKIYKHFIINAYVTFRSNVEFGMSDIDNKFMSKHWFPSNMNLAHNTPFILGIAGYHFMIWFAVFYLNISDWSFLITICNDILLLLCLFGYLFINFSIHNRCKKQVNLHCLTYFNLDKAIKKQHIVIINKEVEHLYNDLNRRLDTIKLIQDSLSVPISNLLISFLYIESTFD